jgi:WD40 repeat protein
LPKQFLDLLNLETIMQPGDRAGFYQPIYEAYGDLLGLLGESQHQSCVLLTSREKPGEISTFEMDEGKVRSLSLSGSWEASLALIEVKKLIGTETEKRQLCEFYNCSPLALKIVAASIQSLFDGEIALFLAEETRVFNGLRRLLDQQFERLSDLEQTIMYWLAINREWTPTTELLNDIVPKVSRSCLLDALESLICRSLIEQRMGCYTQQPVVMEYVIDLLINQLSQELITAKLENLCTYSLLKTTVKDYIRKSQESLILNPIAQQFCQAFTHHSMALENQIQTLLNTLRSLNPAQVSYGAGNLLNITCHLALDLSQYDFSHLSLRHVYLQGKALHHMNFTGAAFHQCTFTQTFGGVLAIAFSPDDRFLALGESNGSIRIWSTHPGSNDVDLDQPLLHLMGHKSWIYSVAWHPHGHRLISGSHDCTLKLWDIKAGTCVKTLLGHDQAISSVAWSPDGQLIASSSHDHTVKIWLAETGECLQTLHHQTVVWYVAWSPDRQTLGSSCDDGKVYLWDWLQDQCLNTLYAGNLGARCIIWSPDGKRLASNGANYSLVIFDAVTGHFIQTLTGHLSWIYHLAWSPDGKTLASCGGDRTIRLWNPQTGDCLHTLSGHQEPVWTMAWSCDSTTLASGSYDQTLRLWHRETGQCRHVLKGYTNWMRCIAWNPDGTVLANSSTDRTIKIWDVETGRCRSTLTGHEGWVLSVAWRPTMTPFGEVALGNLLATSSVDGTIKLWNANTGECVRTLLGHISWVWSVAWSPDGQLLASGGTTNDLTVRLWNPLTGECLKQLSGHQNWIWWVVWSPDGKTLASAGNDQMIKLWDVQTGECMNTLSDPPFTGLGVAWSPDSQRLAIASADCSIQIWEVIPETYGLVLVGHHATIWAIAWSPDGTMLVSGSDEGLLKLWDSASGQCLATLSGHDGRIFYVAWSPDGQTIASSGIDETIRLWDITTQTCFKVMRSDRPYEGMNITGVTGITEAQKATLKALGAIDRT